MIFVALHLVLANISRLNEETPTNKLNEISTSYLLSSLLSHWGNIQITKWDFFKMKIRKKKLQARTL